MIFEDDKIIEESTEETVEEIKDVESAEETTTEEVKVEEATKESVEETNVEETKVEESTTAKPVVIESAQGIVKYANPFNQQERFQRTSNDNFEEKVLNIRRVIKVTKGGRRFNFAALVVVGDKNGKVGYGTAKAKEVPDAIKKAIQAAKKNIYTVKIDTSSDTIYHEFVGKNGASQVILKPAKQGRGLITSGNVRAVVELAGYKNIYTKVIGSRNPQNVVMATIDGLTQIKSEKDVARLRQDKPTFENNKKETTSQKTEAPKATVAKK